LVVLVEMLVLVEMQLMELLDLLVTQDPKVMLVTQALTVSADRAELLV
jgi:hypothetical protein